MVSLLLTESRKTSIWLCESQGTGSNPVRHPKGDVADQVIALDWKSRGVGSIPTVSTKYGGCSSIGRAPDCGSGGSGIVTRHSPKRRLSWDGLASGWSPEEIGSIPVVSTYTSYRQGVGQVSKTSAAGFDSSMAC